MLKRGLTLAAGFVAGVLASRANRSLAASSANVPDKEGGMDDIERLVALEEIKRLKSRRDRALDLKDWADYEALHVPEMYSAPEGQEPWRSAAEMTAGVRDSLAGAATMHHSHAPDITFMSPDKAVGIWAMEDNLYWMQGDIEHWYRGVGFYHETYERREGRWLYTERKLSRVYTKASPGAVLNGKPL